MSVTLSDLKNLEVSIHFSKNLKCEITRKSNLLEWLCPMRTDRQMNIQSNRQIELYYIKNQQDATLAVLFISHWNITLHVSDASRVHHQETKNCSSSHWFMSWVGMIYVYPVRKCKVGCLLHYVIAYLGIMYIQ